MVNQLLLMDRDSDHASALKMYLERHRMEVNIVSSGKDLRHYLDNQRFEIILGDPYFEQTETNNFLKTIKLNSPGIQIIIYGSRKALDLAMDDFGSSVTNYLEKPINSKALDLAIHHAQKCIANERKLANYSQRLSDLHKAQALYHQLFNEVPCYISVQNRDLRLTAANTNFKNDFGSEIGSFCYEIYKHRSSPCPQCPVVQTFKDGKSHGTEEVVTSKSGEQYNVVTQTAPIFDDKGDITQVMEMSTNITQIRQLQDHLSSLGLMLGSMSHGVKGMLTALDGGIYQLESGLKRDDPQRVANASEQIKQMTNRIKKMVLEILYYAKSRELQYETVDANELANTILAMVLPTAEKNDIQLDASIPDSLGAMEVDPSWMQSALVNFLENAVDACIYDTEKESHRVKFTVAAINQDKLCFTIEDNGMGMDRETREKMFTLFFTSKGSQGTGLGLFIANHVVENHGGNIVVESTQNKGTHFNIYLLRKRPRHINIDFLKEKKIINLI